MQADKLRWWSIYREPEHELVGRIQLYIHYTTATDENNMKVQMLPVQLSEYVAHLSNVICWA